MTPRAWPDAGGLADWGAISPGIRARLQAIAEPTVRAPADWHRRPVRSGVWDPRRRQPRRGSGSRYLKVVCQVPGYGYQCPVSSVVRPEMTKSPGCPERIDGGDSAAVCASERASAVVHFLGVEIDARADAQAPPR